MSKKVSYQTSADAFAILLMRLKNPVEVKDSE